MSDRSFDYDRIDVVDFLNTLSIRNVSEVGDEVAYSCPFSGHKTRDSTPSATMQKGTTVAHCFACGWSGNAVTFLSEFEGISPIKARQWLREAYGMAFRDVEGSLAEEIEETLSNQLFRQLPQEYVPDFLSIDHIHSRYVDWELVYDSWHYGDGPDPYPLAYMLDRGFWPETLEEWDVGWDEISQRISIPCFDIEGNLLGFKGRSVDSLPKYLVLGGAEFGFEPYEVSRCLFGIDKATKSPTWAESGHMNLVEGELNCIAMHQKGFTNTVGISGKFLSARQLTDLVRWCSSVVIVMDEIEDAVKAANYLSPFINAKVAPAHDDDPADMNERDLRDLLVASEYPFLLV